MLALSQQLHQFAASRNDFEFLHPQPLRQLLQLFVPIHPDHVPPTSLLREFIGGSGFTY
jgi:hypothetical protein